MLPTSTGRRGAGCEVREGGGGVGLLVRQLTGVLLNMEGGDMYDGRWMMISIFVLLIPLE